MIAEFILSPDEFGGSKYCNLGFDTPFPSLSFSDLKEEGKG